MQGAREFPQLLEQRTLRIAKSGIGGATSGTTAAETIGVRALCMPATHLPHCSSWQPSCLAEYWVTECFARVLHHVHVTALQCESCMQT